MRHSFLPALALSIAFLCATTLRAQSPDEEELTGIAKAAIEAQNDVLVSWNIGQALAKRAEAKQFRDVLVEHVPVISNRRAAMARTGMRYTAHQTTLTINSIDIDSASASLRATESVVLRLETGGASARATEYSQDHVFEFIYDRGWRMVSDTIVVPPPLSEQITAPVDSPPLRDAPRGFRPDRLREPPKAAISKATVSYSATAAVNYALKYVSAPNSNSGYNSAYRAYSNDCTNFISQALRAGGWPFDTSGSRTASDTWYYGSFTWTTSYSWAAAHNFYLFFKQSGRGFFAKYFSQLIKGDIVQADWGPNPDGNISHSMIVTDVVNGAALVTYHSTNTKNRPLADIRAQNPGTNWYGLLMYSSFSQ